MPTGLGRRIQDSICPTCWQEWLRQQVILINEYRLNLVDPQARVALEGQMRQFLNLPGPDQP
jgi:Fe-S cluster biosynthesis and repair protein YggX